MEAEARLIADQTRYHRLYPRWLRPLLHVLRGRDIDRASAKLLIELTEKIARQDARILELEMAAKNSRLLTKRRILLDVTCTNLHDNRTGIQRVVRNIAREFAALGNHET